ncbi:NAD-dependent epimerase/dehydratase family protein [Lysinibacter sp. HNR]|uniref:NAD-dependent epimerase/dehydratase family protein n=1 Tax=Lysinibacter sp. HNR TaxID=3031408 RepID=UPI002434DA05|nr:NAD-dependent epimerase/dehydratase family protein [Lysinibacter sp. HNR]WGD37504.1 NAD-dependent epimerase/dehydratase family protein [Lysinibacter sp. HNR]
MRVLILGGSVFLGRAIADAGFALGHTVAVLNRGFSGPNPSEASAFTGDRMNPTILRAAAAAGPWDLVVDTSGFEPEQTTLSAQLLDNSSRRYVFVSSISAFRDWPAKPISEKSPLLEFSERERSYGSSKAECERTLRATLGNRLTVVYPGLIIGPHENVGRLPWWLARHARGGKIVHPESSSRITPIDARDIANFILSLIDQEDVDDTRYVVSGSPSGPTLHDLLARCRRVTGNTAQPVRVADDLLLKLGVAPWTELPFWVPSGQGADAIWNTDPTVAIRAGLRFRHIDDTIADTWEWMTSIGAATDTSQLPVFKDGTGLSAEKEEEILRAVQH